MIFQSVNENGEPAWQMVLDGRKTVTRRSKPKRVGGVYAVQPGRGKHGVGHIKVKSCVMHIDWWYDTINPLKDPFDEYEREARREGFDRYESLQDWFNMRDIFLYDTYRIEFELVKK